MKEHVLTHPTKPISFKYDIIGAVTRSILPLENSTVLDRKILISNNLTTGHLLEFHGDSLYVKLTPALLSQINSMKPEQKEKKIKKIASQTQGIPHLELTITRTESSRLPTEGNIWEFSKN